MLTLSQPKTTATLAIEVETTHMGTQVTIDGTLAGTIEPYPVWGLDNPAEMYACGLGNTDTAYVISGGQTFPNLSAAVAVVIASYLTNPQPSALPEYF